MRSLEIYQGLNERDKQDIAKLIKTLLTETFINERIYNEEKLRLVTNPLFRRMETFQLFLTEYFEVMDMDFNYNKRMGVAYLTGTAFKTFKLTKPATIILLLLKLIYEEKQKTTSMEDVIIVTIEEIQEKIQTFQMLDKPLAYTTKKDALNLLKRFNLIEDISDDYSKFVVYRSITQILNNNDLKALLIDLGEGSEVNETDESDPSNELALY